MTLDQMILLFIQDSIRCDWLTDIIRAITLMGDNGLIWLVLLLLLLIYPKTRKLGLVAGLSFLLCVGVAEVIKNLVMRPRPFLTIAELVPLVKPPQSYSFPSVHTVSSFSVAWILLWSRERKAIRYAVFAFALLRAFSRLYVGVHYPSDVLTGMLLAFLGSYIVWRWQGHKLS